VTPCVVYTVHVETKSVSFLVEPQNLSYPIFMPKPSTHRMHDPESIIPHIQPNVFTDNQMSRIKYNYYINNVCKDYNDSQAT
jgi:hypothetical protein